jgi:hypothetical protein
MKEIVKKYIQNTVENDPLMEEKIMREGFDFIERRAAWKGLMSDTFQEIEQEKDPKTQTRQLWQYAAAAGVLLIVALGIWAINSPNTPKKAPKPYIQQGNGGDKSVLIAEVDVDKLLNKSVDDFQATTVRKGSNDTDNYQADFQSGKYTDVINALEKMGKKRTVEQSYFLAQAYLKIDPKNTLKAQPLFKEVSAANSDNASDALWSYTLICLLHKQNDAAKIALDEVIEKSNAHKEVAKKLRMDLK